MKRNKPIICAALLGSAALCFVPSAGALEYHYEAERYDNHFYTPTSSNRALDLDSADDAGGSVIVVPSDGMDAAAGTPRAGAPVVPVGAYIDPWGGAVEKQIETDETLNGLEGISFNRLETAEGGGSYTGQAQLVYTDGHFGAVSIGARGLFAYVYPGATDDSMRNGAGHVDGTSVWNGNVVLCGHNRGAWPHFGNLKYVQAGDAITYKTSLGVRTYRVAFAGRILATDTAVLNPTDVNQITMLTCIANEPAYRFCVIGQEM